MKVGVPATRKLRASASVIACVVAFSGCGGCDENILNVGGATLTGPAEVDPGAPVQFTVAGGIGPKPARKKCPRTIQLSWQELDARGRPLNVPGASKGKITEIKVTKNKWRFSTAKGCLLKKPGIRIPVNISPGRTDSHKVLLTASIHGPPPVLPPDTDDPITKLAKVFVALSVGEATKVVTVKGTPQPVNAPPVAAFITSQSPAKAGAPLGLDARQSTDDVAVVRYDWDLDGNGSYEKTSDSPTGVQVDSARASSQPVALRVTDNRGVTAETKTSYVPSSDHGYTDGTPTLAPEATGPGKPVYVSVRRTSPSEAYRAELTCDTTLTSAGGPPVTDQTFPEPCTFASAGFKTVAVKYSGDPSNPSALTPTTFYRLAQIVPGARSSARVAAKTPPLAVPLTLSGATIKKLGRLRIGSTSGTIRGLVATGSGRGAVPKQTPKRFRSALKTLASGRFAVKFSGSGKLESTTINLSGKATMLVRSRRSRKTQICLSVTAAGGGGPARFSVRGATGTARGFSATGAGPPISFAKGTGRTSTVTLAPRMGKARGLSRTCRSLSRVLDGKKRKSRRR